MMAISTGPRRHARAEITVYSLSIGLPPFVILQTIAGKSGENVESLGQGFTGTNAVAFAGAPAAFDVVSTPCWSRLCLQGATTCRRRWHN